MTDCYSIPLSLYIHVPWCVQKCPYCDFNSHPKKGELPENQYIKALTNELTAKYPLIEGRTIQTIFIGGGTPSLFTGDAYNQLFTEMKKMLTIAPNAEITLEANPATLETKNFQAYHEIGINRLSLGVQSFQDEKLKKLGRIHGGGEAKHAVHLAKSAGFTNFNIDLMFGLPNQTINEALSDLYIALNLNPTHLSWYQLTLEPNTLFYKYPPTLPNDDYLWEMQLKGQAFITTVFKQYEISAYSLASSQCQHNLNYWRFGDYLGIGAGAHSKITTKKGDIIRFENIKHPQFYLRADNKIKAQAVIPKEELPLEFMLNACRLNEKISFELLKQRTNLNLTDFEPALSNAQVQKYISIKDNAIVITKKGHQFLNELLEIFIRPS